MKYSPNTGRRRTRLRISGMVFMPLLFALLIALCVLYLKVKSEISIQSSTIEELQEEVSETKKANDARYTYLQDAVSLDEIRERAINELGMTYGDSSQGTVAEDPEPDYIEQKEEIPE